MKYLYYYYYCFFIFIKYSIARDELLSPTVFGANKFATKKNKAMVSIGAYCRSVYTAKETEELLDYASRNLPFNTWKRYHGFGKVVLNPMCSAFPNALYPKRIALARVPISANKFFKLRNIVIPIQPGTMQTLVNEFQYVKRNPLQRPFLECSCNVLPGDLTDNENICAGGTTVHLSRGVCADMSFFVHAPSFSGNFNVVAHIAFPSARPTQSRTLPELSLMNRFENFVFADDK